MPAIARVLVVGAGMAGMTLGLALKRCGIACEIVEIRAALTDYLARSGVARFADGSRSGRLHPARLRANLLQDL
jgi:2-polyprenyl-6-methoxyphenol hydroxylase-like FAD-dependent oxidoreductase